MNNQNIIKLMPDPSNEVLPDLTHEQLQRIGELALLR
jgi:hypothetical protein